jgi:hypothetical protein
VNHEPLQFPLAQGLDLYSPALVGRDLQFVTLDNLEPRLNRIMATKGFSLRQAIAGMSATDRIIDFGYYSLNNRRFVNFYAFSKTRVYRYNFDTGAFITTPIYSGFYDSEVPYVILPWYDALYVTKPNSPLVKIQRDTVTVVANGFHARYGIIANSHLYFGSIGDSFDDYLARLRWSDLDAPENLVIDPNESEADLFDLEPDSGEITGISYQRGTPVVYTYDCLWAGRPIGFPGGFRHEPLIPGIGNIYHGGVIRNKELDFFIGKDNFYALNGLQVVPIGDLIWEYFVETISKDDSVTVRGFIDSRKFQVFWVYPDTDGNKRSVVYNYKEKKWSTRDSQNLTAFFDSPRTALRGYKVIDDYDQLPADLIDTASDLIDDPDAGFPEVLPQLAGTLDDADEPIVADVSNEVLKVDGTEFTCVLETADFYFKTLGEYNEVTKALIEMVSTGEPDVTIAIGSRKNQSEAISWSAEVPIDRVTSGNLAFFFRRFGRGHFLRFRLTWANEATDYVDELLALSLVEVADDSETVEE